MDTFQRRLSIARPNLEHNLAVSPDGCQTVKSSSHCSRATTTGTPGRGNRSRIETRRSIWLGLKMPRCWFTSGTLCPPKPNPCCRLVWVMQSEISHVRAHHTLIHPPGNTTLPRTGMVQTARDWPWAARQSRRGLRIRWHRRNGWCHLVRGMVESSSFLPHPPQALARIARPCFRKAGGWCKVCKNRSHSRKNRYLSARSCNRLRKALVHILTDMVQSLRNVHRITRREPCFCKTVATLPALWIS